MCAFGRQTKHTCRAGDLLQNAPTFVKPLSQTRHFIQDVLRKVVHPVALGVDKHANLKYHIYARKAKSTITLQGYINA